MPRAFVPPLDHAQSAVPCAGPLIEAVRADDAFGAELAAAAERGGSAAVTYSVVEPAAPKPEPDGETEQRSAQRLRTRLRSGKVLDRNNSFLAECVLHDRSPFGSRIRLHEALPIPDAIRFYDDERREIAEAKVMWRRGCDLGILIEGTVSPGAIRATDLARLGGRYYAVPPLRVVTNR